MGAISIHHVQLPFPLEKGAEIQRFYTVHLGLKEIISFQQGGYRFALGEIWLDFAPSPAQVRDLIAQVAIHVEDLPALRHRLVKDGYVLDESIALNGYRRFFVDDPAGNRLEILEQEPHGAYTV